MEFLTDRPQFVRFMVNSNTYFSSNKVINVGSPQGTCISPALFTIYTDDCRSEFDRVKVVVRMTRLYLDFWMTGMSVSFCLRVRLKDLYRGLKGIRCI